MSQKKLFIGISMLVMIAVLGMGCSTGNSGSDDEDTTDQTAGTGTGGGAGTGESAGTGGSTGTGGTGGTTGTAGTGGTAGTTTPAALTLSDIVGKWENTFFYSGYSGDETDITTLTINADGTFMRYVTEDFEIKDEDFQDNCWAEKGTVSVSADGTVTFVTTHVFWKEDGIITDLSGVTWVEEACTRCSYAAKEGGKLFLGVFRRQGTGTGIKGTWVSEENDGEELVKTEFIFADTPGANAAIRSDYYYLLGKWELEKKYTYDSYEITSSKINFYASGSLQKSCDFTYTDNFFALDSGFVKK